MEGVLCGWGEMGVWGRCESWAEGSANGGFLDDSASLASQLSHWLGGRLEHFNGVLLEAEEGRGSEMMFGVHSLEEGEGDDGGDHNSLASLATWLLCAAGWSARTLRRHYRGKAGCVVGVLRGRESLEGSEAIGVGC